MDGCAPAFRSAAARDGEQVSSAHAEKSAYDRARRCTGSGADFATLTQHLAKMTDTQDEI